MTVILQTDRLILRVWTLDDIDAGCAIWGDPEVMRFVDDGRALGRDEVQRSIEAGIDHQNRHGCQHWAVEETATGDVVGCCGFNVYEGGPDLELVYHFARAHWGKGYATEAAGACLKYTFENLNPLRIVASTVPDNAASVRVLEKIGMAPAGTITYDDGEELFFELTAPPDTGKD